MSTLSIEKLRNILKKKGIIPIKYFLYKDKILFIQVFIIKNCNLFILYIEPEFSFKLEKNSFKSNEKACFINRIEIEKLMRKNLNKDIRNIYSDINIVSKINLDDSRIGEKLNKEYEHIMTDNDIKKDEDNSYLDTYKQIDRIKNSFSKLKYKISIFSGPYFFIVIDDKIKCYIIEKFEEEQISYNSSYYIVSNIQNLFEKIESIDYEINEIKGKIEGIWDHTQKTQYDRIIDLYKNKDNVSENYKIVYNKKLELMNIRNKLNETLEQTYNKYKDIEQDYNSHIIKMSTIKDVNNDANNIHYKKKLEDKTNEYIVMIDELTNKINKISDKIKDYELTIDKVFYNNFLMMNSIRKNILQLSDLTK
jgi:hypothetical protein